MSISKIYNTEIEANAVSSLPTRPSAPSLYSGSTLSAKELRASFDRLPLLLAERFNALIDAFGLYTDEDKGASLAALIATGIAEGHSLEALFADIASGRFSTYLSVEGEGSLSELFSLCKQEIASLASTISALSEENASLLSRLLTQEEGLQEEKARALAIERESKEGLLALKSALPTAFRITEVDSEAYAKVYRLEYRQVGKDGEPYLPLTHSVDINIPRDLVVKSGALRYCERAGEPVSTYEVGEAYIDLTLSSENAEHIYIRVGDLVKTTLLREEGEGDILTDISAVGNTLTLKRGLSSLDFVKKEELEALSTLKDEQTGVTYAFSFAIRDGKPGILLTEKT